MTTTYDDGGLPIHLPIWVNTFGQGPLSDLEAKERYALICWCVDGPYCDIVPIRFSKDDA